MTNNDAGLIGPIIHRVPNPATIKQLYGTAFRCGEPACIKPLYRVNDETGEFILNSRIAHIHARSEGGPRWNPEMSETDNRCADNLIPLCEEHAFEIDATPQHFPADLLRDWKRRQLEEYRRLQKSWALTDDEAAEALVESFNPRTVAVITTTATTVVAAARLTAALIETARQQRGKCADVARSWWAMRQRVNLTIPVFDFNGERVQVEPSIAETAPYRAALEAALTVATSTLEPIATQLIAELHAVSTSDGSLSQWCGWVESSARQVVSSAGRWPAKSLDADDEQWPTSVDGLAVAIKALAAAWRGESADTPPSLPDLDQQHPPESDGQRLVREHKALLESARPWARVTHRPYDAELVERLLEATWVAAELPNVLSFMPFGLDATTRLAAKVARNADDETFRGLIDKAKELELLAASVCLLEHLRKIAQDCERSSLFEYATAELTQLLTTEDWDSMTTWTANRMHVRALFWHTEAFLTTEMAREKIESSLHRNPELLEPIILGMTQWSELLVSDGSNSPIRSRLDSLPEWFPATAVAEAIRHRLPELEGADEDDCERYAQEFERLASRVLWLADGSPVAS